MVKYLFKPYTSLLLLLALLALLASASKVPVPTCNAPRISELYLPISLQETQTFNMDEFFGGYNLNYDIVSKPAYVGIRSKLFTLKNKTQPQPGLRNYHIGGQGNGWGNTLVTLSEENNSTVLRWGAASSNSSLPDLSNSVIVENDTKVRCFDAVWFRAEMTLLIDCVQNSSSFGLGLENFFYYVNSSTKATLGKVKNDMYVPFTNIRHRKIRLHTEDGYHYLIRAYFAEAVDLIHATNTYAEILSVNNPMKPWTIRVMDRSFLHQDKLTITDFEVYLGDIYILDYFSGVIKFDISRQQTIIVVGRYRTDSGYTKMGVYSSNLDNEFLLVLAHNHTIMEIDWTNQIRPEIVTKYSIPDNSWIHDLWVNERYVVVQIAANLTNDKQQEVEYQSTYVFTRGSRTYTNAYVAIPHVNFHAFVDMHRDNNQLLTIDSEQLAVYQLSSPILTIMPTSPDLKGKNFSFVVKATSANEYNTFTPLVCTFTFRYVVVDVDLLSIWPTGVQMPQHFYANYPGQLFIPTDREALGGNITYGVYHNETDKYSIPTHYFLHQNNTKISWDSKPPSMMKYTYLVTEQFDSLQNTEINIYAQDSSNVTYFSRCGTIPYTDDVHCFENTHAPHINMKIVNLTATRFHYYAGQYVHLAAVLYEDFPNQVFLYHVEERAAMNFKPIIFAQGYEGQIQNIEFLGHYLVVVLRYVKQIVFFDMIQCEDNQQGECKQVYRINSTTMSQIGVNYFSPMDVYVSDYHPFVLFVQCLDRVLLLDITRNGPIKLAEVKSPATQEPGFYKWKMAIAHGELILVNPPNTIEEHDLDELYISGDVPFNRVYPTYNYTIPDKFDLDFSDTGNLVYIAAIDKNLPVGQNTVIMVYRSGLPAVASFYDVFHLNAQYDDLLLEVTGSFGDYVACAFGSKLMMFRQYEVPILVFQDVFGDFTFNLTFTNDPTHLAKYSSQSTVHTANYPEDIIINNTQLNKTNFLSREVNETDTAFWAVLDDSTWFNGSVLNYTLTGCDQCNKKLKVINHVQQERELLGVHNMEDYAFSPDGGYIQQFQSIIKMQPNGSIHQFVGLPSVLDGENCMLIEHNWIYDFTVSACKNEAEPGKDSEIYLYTTVYSASKPFVNGPYYSSAKHVTSMHIMQELLVIVDVDERPFAFDREGGIIIYAMNHDPFEPEIFDELEFIDSTDLSAANDWPGGPVFIGNAHFAFTNKTDTYRLIITELRHGLFVLDFKWTKNRKSVEILKIEFIDLAEELTKLHLPLPNLAFFTAVAINKEEYNSQFSYWNTEVIVATSNFHSFQINLHIDKTGTIATHEIVKVFYRYGFYENENYIKAFDGYFAIGQKLPIMLHPFPWYSKLVLTVYDTREKWIFNQTSGQKTPYRPLMVGTNLPVSYMLGGYCLDDGKVTFDWNFTFTRNSSNPFHNIGLVGVHDRSARIREFRVHEKLIFRSQNGISSTQQGMLLAQNDYHNIEIPIKLLVNKTVSEGGIPGWAIALIVVGSLAVGAGLGFLIYTRFVKGKAPNRESETEKSLLEREGEQDDKDEDDDDEDADDEGEQDDQEEGEQEQEQIKPENKLAGSTEANQSEVRPAAEIDTSINRETITTVVEEERPAEVAEPAAQPQKTE